MFIADYKGRLFLIQSSHGVGPTPQPQPKPIKIDETMPWAEKLPIHKMRFVDAGQFYRPYDLADFI
jgi:hypothetical protein